MAGGQVAMAWAAALLKVSLSHSVRWWSADWTTSSSTAVWVDNMLLWLMSVPLPLIGLQPLCCIDSSSESWVMLTNLPCWVITEINTS